MGDTNFRRTGRRTAKGPYRSEELQRKRDEGNERNAEWAALSTPEKVASLKRRHGKSAHQIGKLTTNWPVEPE